MTSNTKQQSRRQYEKHSSRKARSDKPIKEYVQKRRHYLYGISASVSKWYAIDTLRPILIKDNEPLLLSYFVSKVLDYPYKNKTYAVGVGGCGMDMGFHLVNTPRTCTRYSELKHRWIIRGKP
jgi:hypothetical protein